VNWCSMKVGVLHCLLIIFVFLILQAVVFSAASRSRIIISSGDDHENCTREGDVIICPCNVTVNGTYYPCWIPLNNATFPTPNNTCFECPFGSFTSNETNPNCTKQCGAGSCIDPFKCDLCPAGSFANETGSVECTLCVAGYCSRSVGSQNCSTCPEGTYSTSGSISCTNCPSGYFASSPASGKCDPCPPGEYSKEAAALCLKCGQGTYNSNYGSGSCTPCGVGYYSPNFGQTDRSACVPCPAGSYCPDSQTAYPVSCPRNYYCNEGASAAILCSPLYQSRPGQPSCSPSMGFYLLIFGIVGLVAVTLVVVWRWFTTKQRVQSQPQQHLEIARLIPKPRDGPVYNGL